MFWGDFCFLEILRSFVLLDTWCFIYGSFLLALFTCLFLYRSPTLPAPMKSLFPRQRCKGSLF